jgi:hypothetical protein
LELAEAMVPPAPGEQVPTEEQKKLAQQWTQEAADAAKQAAGKVGQAPGAADALKKAAESFFAASAASALNEQKIEEQAKKDQEALTKALEASATAPPAQAQAGAKPAA